MTNILTAAVWGRVMSNDSLCVLLSSAQSGLHMEAGRESGLSGLHMEAGRESWSLSNSSGGGQHHFTSSGRPRPHAAVPQGDLPLQQASFLPGSLAKCITSPSSLLDLLRRAALMASEWLGKLPFPCIAAYSVSCSRHGFHMPGTTTLRQVAQRIYPCADAVQPASPLLAMFLEELSVVMSADMHAAVVMSRAGYSLHEQSVRRAGGCVGASFSWHLGSPLTG